MSSQKLMLEVLKGRIGPRPPIWMMRQAGRHLPEYMEVRNTTPDFVSFCYDSAKAAEVTLQPIRRYGFDASIVFADILLIPDALGQSVVTGPNVPKRISQSINVESGLNDGLALPVVLVAAIFAAQATGFEGGRAPDNITLFAFFQITLGPLAGALVGYGAAKLLDLAVDRNAATTVAQGLYFLSIAFLAYFGAELIGGNGFIAAFVGGLVFGNTLRAPSMFIHEFMEGEGQLLTLATFLVFGAVLAPIGLEHANWKTVTLALLFLTVVRIVPIWLSLAGLKASNYEKIFLGWFGPRGLASILFALLVLERFPIPGAEELVACVVLTVLLSIVLHGVTATPLSNHFKTSVKPE